MPEKKPDGGRGAALVGAGILLSRLMGLVRQRLFAHALGSSPAAAAFNAALRIPNFLQNLLGEGVLSASFIPVYAALRSQKKDDEANEVASAVFGLLSLMVAALVASGLFAAPILVELVAPGFSGETRELTVQLVRILFPGTGVLVLSAWCLGVLNSHRRFFLSYAAPVLWNGCIIIALLVFRGSDANELAKWTAWGVVIGGFAQFFVQLPATLRLLQRFRPTISIARPSVRQVLRSFTPAVASRGVVQLSAYVDVAYASLISERAVAVLSYAQTIALLPVSLFGTAISAAELPSMSEDAAGDGEDRLVALRMRLAAAMERLLFFVAPSAVAFALLGDVIAGLLLQSGRFGPTDTRLTWYILIGASVGLVAQTRGRLLASAFFALKDTRTPLKFAVIRVSLGAVLGYLAVRVVPAQLGLPAELGAAGVTATTAATAWLECELLARTLFKKIGETAAPTRSRLIIWCASLIAGVAALGVRALAVWHFGKVPLSEWGGQVMAPPLISPLIFAPVCLGVFGVVYLVITAGFGLRQASSLLGKVMRRR